MTVPCSGVSAALLVLVVAACANRIPAAAPGTGVITVGATTTGAGVNDLTFAVRIDNEAATGRLRADGGVFTARNLPPGEHTVRLADLPPRCRIAGDAERKVTLSAQRTAVVRFAVSCS